MEQRVAIPQHQIARRGQLTEQFRHPVRPQQRHGLGQFDLLIEIENFPEARKRLQMAVDQLQDNLKWASAVFSGSLALLDALEGELEHAEERLLTAIEQLRSFNEAEFGKLHAKGYLIYRMMGEEAKAAAMLEVAAAVDAASESSVSTDIQFVLEKSLASRRVQAMLES